MIEGSIILLPDSSTEITLDPNSGTAPITVTGTLSINGSLTLTLSDTIQNGTVVPIIAGSGDINVDFTDITVNGDGCENLAGTQEDSTTEVGILVSVDDSDCGKGLSKGAIAGIAIGAVAFLALIVLLGLLLYNKLHPSAGIFAFHSKNESGWR